MRNPCIVANDIVYWKFPSSTERLAAIPAAYEVGRLAWQVSDNTFYILTSESPITWSTFGGGSVLPLTSKGDILTHNGVLALRKAVGANGALLEADSTQADGLAWRAATLVNAYPANMSSVVSPGVLTRVPFDSVSIDPTGSFDAANNALKSTVAGKYFILTRVRLLPIDVGSYFIMRMYKNGSQISENIAYQVSAGAELTLLDYALVAMNGTTDSIDVRILIASGSGVKIYGTPYSALSAFRTTA